MKEIYITLYKAEWCGYCRRFKPDWEKIKKVFSDKNIIDELKNINLKVIVDEYDDDANKDVIIKAQIKYYPTLKVSIIDENQNKKTFELKDDERQLNNLVDTVFKNESKNLKELLKSNLNKMSGGYFDYSKNKKVKYYNEYQKCKNLYLKLKSKNQ
jgi:thiol-disulfide isomerase/thioredoxin